MKLLVVFSFVCLLQVCNVWSQKLNPQFSIARLIITDCLKEFDAASQVQDPITKQYVSDATCLYACGLRKWSEERGLTLHNGLLEMIDEAYKMGFQATKFTRTDVTAKVKRCSFTESNDCEFSKCVGIFGPPFVDVYLHYINHQPQSVFKTRPN